MNPMDLFALNLKAATMMTQASSVMAIRLGAMSGMIPAQSGENQRMIDEKSAALAKSLDAGTAAMMDGKAPIEIMDAVLNPISTKVNDNHERLTKR